MKDINDDVLKNIQNTTQMYFKYMIKLEQDVIIDLLKTAGIDYKMPGSIEEAQDMKEELYKLGYSLEIIEKAYTNSKYIELLKGDVLVKGFHIIYESERIVAYPYTERE